MNAFRRAALAKLRGMQADPQAGRVRADKVIVEIELADRRDVVSLWMSDDELLAACTCGKHACVHAQAALALCSETPPSATVERSSVFRVVHPTAAGEQSTSNAQPPLGASRAALIEVLQDLIGSVVRSGASAGASATVENGIARLLEAVASPTPGGVSRWIGRFKRALAEADAAELVRVLAGADRLLDDLSAAEPSADQRQRVQAWLPLLSAERERVQISDVTLVEVAREQLEGAVRAGVERRYLIDLRDGRVSREDHIPGTEGESLGPCPRLLTVSLASIEPSAPPARMHLYQYTVTPVVEADIWRALAQHAERDFAALGAAFCTTLEAFAGLCEPFALVAPERVLLEANPVLVDKSGRKLSLCGDDGPATLRFFETFVEGADPLWVAGRLVDREGSLALIPLSAAMTREGQVCYAQL